MKKEEKEKLHTDDRFIQFMSRVWGRMSAGGKRFRLVLLVALALGVVALVILGLREGMTDAERSVVDGAQTTAEMKAAAEKYPHSTALLLRLGQRYAAEAATEADVGEAEKTLEAAYRSASSSNEKALTALALGKVKTNRRDYAAALSLFEDAAKEPATQPLIEDQANWYAARCLELMGKTDEAAKTYAKIGLYQASIWKMLAEYRQTRMRQESLE